MASPRSIAAYPVEYFELLRRATSGETVTVILSNKKSAEKLRFQLYGFRRALLANPDSEPELALMAEGLELLIKDERELDQAKLIIRLRDGNEMTQAVRQALGDR